MEIAFIPNWLIKQFVSKFTIQHELNILISNAFIILLFLILKNRVIELMNLVPHFCLFDKFFKIECPVCGTTRALCEISKGNLNGAYYLNFSSLFVALYFLAQIPLRFITLCNNQLIAKINLISKILESMVLCVILINWLFKLIKL